MKVTEEDLDDLMDDLVEAKDEGGRVGAVASFIAGLTPNGPIPSFLDDAFDRAEAEVYDAAYGKAKKWAQKAFQRDPAKRAERRKRRQARRRARRKG